MNINPGGTIPPGAIRSSRFSPRLVPPGRLDELFVGHERRRMLRRLVDDVFATRDAGGGRYEVVVAPRGAGKSHLLGLVSHRLRTDGRRGVLLVAELTEEEHPSGYVDLLARVLASLPEEENIPCLGEQVRTLRRTQRAEQDDMVEGMLRARVGERPVVLLIENLDRVFSAIGTQGQQRLRALLHAKSWSLIATSCTWGNAFTSPKAPFYNGLLKNALPAFSDADAIAMMRNLAAAHDELVLVTQLETARGRARLRAMRLLMGGNPRAMALLFPFLRDGRLDDLESTLFALAEEWTPHYQDQMSRLPDGQRPYLEHLAGNWTPMGVSELAERTFATPQTASGQLRYLRRDQLVTSNTLGRESFYEIAEPLHRLALCMKRGDKAPAALARMAAAWMERDELKSQWMGAHEPEALESALDRLLDDPASPLPPLSPDTGTGFAASFCEQLLAYVWHDAEKWHPLLLRIAHHSSDWAAVIELALIKIIADRWIPDHPSEFSLRLIDRIEGLLPDSASTRTCRALRALPGDSRPFFQLADPERYAARAILSGLRTAASLLSAIPAETVDERSGLVPKRDPNRQPTFGSQRELR